MPHPEQRPAVVLVGGGHAHVEVLRRLAEEDHPPMRAVLVNPATVHHYSGMAPGYVAGLYRQEELTFDLAELAARAGAELVLGKVEAIDPEARRLDFDDGRSLAYDLVSFDVGSAPAGAGVPGVREHALPIKPLSRVVEARGRLLALAAERAGGGTAASEAGMGDGGTGGGGTGPPCRVVVVGAGAAGVEVAFAAARLLDDAGTARRITLLEAGPRILAGYDDAFRRRARRALEGRDIAVREGTAVAAVEAGAVRVETAQAAEAGAEAHSRTGDGVATRLPSDLTLWLTGPAAPPLFAGSGLPLDERGYLLVDETLRAPGFPRVFASGDCATLAGRPDTPKAGVYAVRQAPVLWRALTVAAAGGDPAEEGVSYTPQEGFLSLLNTCDGRALLSWKGLSAHARWAWWLKDWIDRRFMRRYG